MYKKALTVIVAGVALFAILLWSQYSQPKRLQGQYQALEQAMKAELNAWQHKGEESADPRPAWKRKWSQFAEQYPHSEQSFKAHIWALSLMSSMSDAEGLANYLDVAVRYPDNPAVPAILHESVPLHLQIHGLGLTNERLTRIAQNSKNPEIQAAAYVRLADLEEDDTKKVEALQRFLASYGTTAAAKDARQVLEEVKLVGIGAQAPHFEFTDTRGKEVELGNLKGKWVLLDFWATWCIPCEQEIPHMREIFEEFKGSSRFAMLGISLDYDKEVLLARLKKERMNWPQYVDGMGWENKISRLYRVTSIPNTVLIDPEGKIRYKRLPGAELKKILTEKLG